MQEIRNWLIRSFLKAEPIKNDWIPKWQAHRGYWIEGAPQNSLQSLTEATQAGAKMVEFDVRLTKDLIPILFHDAEFILDGESYRVSEMTLLELKNKLSVTTLREVLVSESVPQCLNIELKTETVLDESLERRVVDLIHKTQTSKRILFSSFNPASIYKLSQFAPNIPRALLVSPQSGSIYLNEMWLAPFLKFQFLNLDHQMIDESLMSAMRARRIPIAAWTVNDPKRQNELLEMGVRSIISDQKLHFTS